MSTQQTEADLASLPPRQYLDQTVVPTLLDGLKVLVNERCVEFDFLDVALKILEWGLKAMWDLPASKQTAKTTRVSRKLPLGAKQGSRPAGEEEMNSRDRTCCFREWS